MHLFLIGKPREHSRGMNDYEYDWMFIEMRPKHNGHIGDLPHPETSAKPVSVSTWQGVIWESVEDINCVRLLQSEKNRA